MQEPSHKIPSFTKIQLAQALSKKYKLTGTISKMLVDDIFNFIAQALKQEKRVEIRGLGSFELRQRRSYQGHHPKTGELIQIPAKKRLFFKPGKLRKTEAPHKTIA